MKRPLDLPLSWILAATACFPAAAVRSQVPVYTATNPPPTPTVQQLPLQTEVTRDGIRWTFSSAVPVGQFLNRDPYVVGPVTVVAIDPPPQNGRNGSVVNIPPTDNRSGFDSRTPSGRYDPTLRSDPPISLQPGDSLVSSISVDTIGLPRVLRPTSATGSPVRSLSILTCLAAPVPPDAFRPSYGDPSNTIYLSRNLDRSVLPELPKPASTPTLAEFEGYFRRPWVDTVFFGFDAPVEYMPDYGREVARAVGMSGLLLCLDFTAEEKEALLVYLVQYGIDLHGMLQAGHPGWRAWGGHGSGRKFPILLAGHMLGEPAMQDPSGLFGEDMQTMYDQAWQGASVVYAGHVGAAGFPSMTGWGAYEHLQPREWLSSIGENYRRCCTSVAFVGFTLAARLMGLQGAWNHPPLFDYVDRWMVEDDTEHLAIIQQQTGLTYPGSWEQQGQAWDAFVDEMFAAHRSPAAYQAIGTGCPGSNGETPSLQLVPGSSPTLGQTWSQRLTGFAGAPFVALGTSDQIWNGLPLPFSLAPLQMPGCQVITAWDLVVPLTAQGTTATLEVPLPAAPALLDATLFCQGVIADPGANPGGLAVSNAVRAILGL